MLDIYNEVTSRIIAALEQGVIPWHKPWVGGNSGCISYSTGKPYSLLNHILLGGISGEYATFRQIQQQGGHVRRGEKAHMVVFWKFLKVVDEETQEEKEVPYLKYINVFNVAIQCEGISPRWTPSAVPASDLQPDAVADAVVRDYIDRSGVHLSVTESDRAFYRPSSDEVVVPKLSQYQQVAEYYSTLFHELTHSTGHRSRLNRIADTAAFGSEQYSREELCAELGSAFLVNHCGLESESSFRNSAGYIQGWLKALKDDKRLVVSAAGAAEKAVSLILNRKEGVSDVGNAE